MKIKPLLILAAMVGCRFVAISPVLAQIRLVNSLPSPSPSSGAAPSGVTAQLQALQAKVEIRKTAAEGKGPPANSHKAWADIVQAFDSLLAAHKNEKTDAVAQVALAKAMLYAGVQHGGVFYQWDICVAQLKEVVKDYPGTPTARQATQLVQEYQADADYLAARRQLVGQPMPDFHVRDYEGRPLSPAGFKGKVVLLDYCGPGCPGCLLEMPGIANLYGQYRAQGFEVIGVCWASSFQGGGSIKANLSAFLQAHDMTWPVFCDGAPPPGGRFGQNELFQKLCVGAVLPDNYLVGRDGKIVGMDLKGDDLDDAVAKALAAK